MQDTSDHAPGIRDVVQHVVASYEDLDRRFEQSGGLSALLGVYERIRQDLERTSHDELDRLSGEIKQLVELLLRMDYELRSIQELKRALDAGRAASVPR